MKRPLAVEARRLVKVYPGGVKALRGLDAEIPIGTTSCIAGPNGAGKTTFIRIASTILTPTSGYIFVMGYDAISEVWKVRKLVAVMPQEGRPFNDSLNVFEAVYYYLLSRGMGLSTAKREARRVLEDLDLWHYRNRLLITLSGGLKRRTLLAMVLATGAEVVFLDEPTTGLDPEARRTTWGYIKRLARDGQTIIFSTHQLAEAETVSDTIILINNGLTLGHGSPKSLIEMLPYRYKVVTSSIHIPDSVMDKALKIRSYSSLSYIYTDTVEKAIEIASELILETGSARVDHVDLEDLFIELTETSDSLNEVLTR